MNILLAGVGGQGTVLASKILAECAMSKGLEAKTAETIGMAQRGGCVVSHVRLGPDNFSPLIPKGAADLLIAFEPAEAVRNISYLRQGGAVVVNKKAVRPVTASLSASSYTGEEMLAYLRANIERLFIVDGDAGCAECGSAKVLNFLLLGAAARSGCVDISCEELSAAVDEKLPERFRAINKKALLWYQES